MDRTPGGDLRDSISHYDFSADEIEVATILTQLKFYIPLYDFRNSAFLPSLWGSKRLRSVCASELPRTESMVATDCPVISRGVNLGNISPDSPLLLKASPPSGGGAQGSPCIVMKPPLEKEKPEKTERRSFSRTILGQSHGQLSVSQLTPDPSSATDPQPNGGAHAIPGSPLLFDLNLMPPDCSGIQSPLPNEDGTPRLSPSDGAVADNGSNKAEATEATRQKSFRDKQGEMPQGCSIGNQGTEPSFPQIQ